MCYVRLEDSYDGVRVFFDDVPNEDTATLSPTGGSPRWTVLDAHTIRFETTFVRGTDNDVVRIFLTASQGVR